MSNVKTTVAPSKAGTTERPIVRDEEGNFLFRKEWLSNYAIIDGPGLWTGIRVIGEPTLYDPAEYGEVGNPRFIVNLQALVKSDLPKIKETLKDADYVRAEDMSGMTLNGNIWVNADGVVPKLPHRRQLVDINVDYVPNRQGEMVLRVTDIYPPEGKVAKKVDTAALFSEIDEE